MFQIVCLEKYKTCILQDVPELMGQNVREVKVVLIKKQFLYGNVGNRGYCWKMKSIGEKKNMSCRENEKKRFIEIIDWKSCYERFGTIK